MLELRTIYLPPPPPVLQQIFSLMRECHSCDKRDALLQCAVVNPRSSVANSAEAIHTAEEP